MRAASPPEPKSKPLPVDSRTLLRTEAGESAVILSLSRGWFENKEAAVKVRGC